MQVNPKMVVMLKVFLHSIQIRSDTYYPGQPLIMMTSMLMSFLILDLNSTWSSWSSWSQCSVTCREGVQIRTRSCLTDSCDNLTVQHEERLCALGNCPNGKM